MTHQLDVSHGYFLFQYNHGTLSHLLTTPKMSRPHKYHALVVANVSRGKASKGIKTVARNVQLKTSTACLFNNDFENSTKKGYFTLEIFTDTNSIVYSMMHSSSEYQQCNTLLTVT